MDEKDLEKKSMGATEQQDREWAKALNMEYTPPQPPPIPADALPKDAPASPADAHPADAHPADAPASPLTGSTVPRLEADGLAQPIQPNQANQADQPNQPDQPPQAPLPPLPPRQQFRPAPPTEPMPKTYLVWAIVATMCCCLPLGAVAIIFASKVTSLYYKGDLAGARKASERAQLWIIITIVGGVLTNILYLPLMMLLGDFSTGMQF